MVTRQARVVEVEVLTVSETEVEVRLADGRTGVVARSDFPRAVLVGEVVPAALLARDDPKGRVVLSHAWARKEQAWEHVERAKAAGEPVRGRVIKVVKGGLLVDLGLRAFLPASMVSDGPNVDPAALVGTELEALVTEADRHGDRVVLSRRDLLRRLRRQRERELLASLEPNQRVSGEVVAVADHGAIVDLGGLRGLVHRSELSWQRFSSPEEVVSVGQRVEVEVLEVNRSKRRISLSLRRTAPDPMAGLEPGMVLGATVTRVVDYGAFVRLDSGAEGLVHLSELSDVPGLRADQLVVPREELTVKVLEVDRDRRRLALSVRRVVLDD